MKNDTLIKWGMNSTATPTRSVRSKDRTAIWSGAEPA